VDVEIRPEPENEERVAIVAALEALLRPEAQPPAYRSGWRAAGIRENLAQGREDGA
jgi:hypothetical protein